MRKLSSGQGLGGFVREVKYIERRLALVLALQDETLRIHRLGARRWLPK